MKYPCLAAVAAVFFAGCSSVKPLPDVAQSYRDRGLVMLYVEVDYDAAVGDYSKAIEFNPEDADAYAGRGLAYLKKKNRESAAKDFEKAASLNPALKKPLEDMLKKTKADDWWYLGCHDDGTTLVYVDKKSVELSGRTLTYSARIDRTESDAVLVQVQIDCSASKMRSGADGVHYHDWQDIGDGSYVDIVAKKHCPR